MKKILYIFSLLINSHFLIAQVNVNFTADVTEGCDFLVVNFSNSSTGQGDLTYNWNFGNSQTSTLENPTVTYLESGYYTVSLIVDNGAESDTLIIEEFIKVYSSPVANFQADTNKGCMPFLAEFSSNSTQGSSPIVSFEWVFGDDAFGDGEDVSHVYANAGVYTVSLFIEDSAGCTDSHTESNFINVFSNPSAQFNSFGNIGCDNSLTVSFQDNSTGNEPFDYYWDFGNGEVSELKDPIASYQGYGMYNVSLSVTDINGCRNTKTKVNHVALQELVINANIAEDEVCKMDTLTITNNSTGLTSSKWIFGDGTISNSFIPEKSYTKSGEYDILYVANYNNSCFDTLTFQLVVDSIKADFITDTTYGCELPFVVNYLNQSVNASSWQWKFGNGQVSSLENPQIIYGETTQLLENSLAHYSDTLIATSPHGCIDTIVMDTSVYIVIPKIMFAPNSANHYLDEISGCVPFTVNFRDSSINNNDDDNFVDWFWEFHDGSTSTELNPSFNYSEHGDHDVVLTVTNQSGCQNSFSTTIYAGSVQTANFDNVGDHTVCGSESIEFIDLSDDGGLVNAWIWSFGDGETSQIRNPSHQFVDTGYMTVSLQIFYNGCAGTPLSKDSMIYVQGAAGNIFKTVDCNLPFNYAFQMNVNGIDEGIWDFGDDNTLVSIDETVYHEYNSLDDYVVSFTGNDSQSGCTITKAITANLRLPQADFLFTENNCLYDSVIFDPSISIDEELYYLDSINLKYTWIFHQLADTIYSKSGISKVFNNNGNYDVSLIIRDINKCYDTTTHSLNVNNPRSNFSSDITYGCSPLEINFLNNSTSETLLKEFLWNFGDGTTSTETNPVKNYNLPGKFNVSLISVDTNDCRDTLLIPEFILSSRPIPNVQIPSNNACLGSEVKFTNNSIGNGLTAEWDFGDNTTSTEYSPTHTYPDTGYYDISLYLIDTLGCDSSIIYTDFIKVNPVPIADFISDINNAECYPALITFSDFSQASNTVNWKWNFGDGSSSENNKNPRHNYTRPGIFDVEMIVFTEVGCSDTIIKDDFIEIEGPYAEIIAPDEACINQPYIISKENTLNVFNFNWIDDIGNTYFEDNVELNFNDFGTKNIFLYITSDDNGTCDILIKDSIIVPELYAGIQLSDSSGCIPYSFNVSENAIGGNTFNWYLNESLISNQNSFDYILDQVGNYMLKQVVTSSINCHDSVTKTIEVFPLPEINLTNDTIICVGDTITLRTYDGILYEWSNNVFINDTSTAFTRVFPNEETWFYVKVTDENVCINNDSVLVSVQQIPIINMQNTDTIDMIIGESVDLSAHVSIASDYYWFPESYLTCTNCLYSTSKPLETIKYYFNAADFNGCFQVKDSVFITVDIKFSLDLPEAFTPDNDGINDLVFVKGWGIKELVEFKVFDQTGRVVFKTNDIEEAWDGKYNGDFLLPGTYIYDVKVLSYDNQVRGKKGYIYLIR